MKIEVDTNNDNEEHIRHAIRLLQSLVEGRESFTNEVPSMQQPAETPQQDTGLMNMFGESSAAPTQQPSMETYGATEQPQTQQASSYPDQSGFGNYGNQESTARMPEKEDAPPGSLFGMFRDATMKKRDDDPDRVVPY